MPIKDLSGQRFGRLTVIPDTFARVQSGKRRATTWDCLCDCGNVTTVHKKNLETGNTSSCGCKFKDTIYAQGVDLTGHKFGRLTVLGGRQNGNVAKKITSTWRCLCRCGNELRVTTLNLRSGNTKSCGCLRDEHNALSMGKMCSDRDVPRSVYLCKHPTKHDHYKIGIALNPRYRERKSNGSLVLLDYVTADVDTAFEVEQQILAKTKHCQVRPSDMERYSGRTEWRQGEDAVRVWHEEASKLAQAA